MTKIKMFTGTAETVERDANAYLEQHPELVLQNIQLTNDARRVIMAIAFSKVSTPFHRLPETARVPLPMQPVEITCDPWKGEFIPVGDPPIRHVSYEMPQ